MDGATTIAKREQYFDNNLGGGGRSGTLFPISGSITNNQNTNPRSIIVSLIVSSDSVDFTGRSNAFDACMKITEIAL
jgi:hypothetical protein